MKKTATTSVATILRRKAEEVLKKKTASKSTSHISEAEAVRLKHELEVHHIELELQIDELQLARNNANEIAEKYVELFDFSPTGYLLLSASGEIQKINFACARMLGKERSQLTKSRFGFFVSRDTRPHFNLFFEKLFKSKTKEACDVTLLANDGEPLYVQLAGINSGGDQCLITISDVTDRKHAEDALRKSEIHYRTLFEKAPEGIFYLSPDLYVQKVNDSFAKMHGYRVEEMQNMNLQNLSNPESMLQVSERVEEVLSGNTLTCVVKHYHKDGHIFPLEVTLSLISFGDEKIMVAFHRDVTEREETENLLHDMQRWEGLGILTSGIAHTFNNFLGVMMGNISLAQKKLPTEHTAVNNIDKALSAMDRASQLTQQMLAYTVKGRLQICTFDLGALVQEHVSLFNVSLPKNVNLVTQLPSTPVFVNGDQGKIEQIVLNLIVNGGEAIQDNRGDVTIALSTVSCENDDLASFDRITGTKLKTGCFALLEVFDSGCGIPQETIPKIFDPFFTTKFKGHGLGLSSVLEIIREHKGGISVHSTEGEGTVVRVILPIVKPMVVAEEPVNEERQMHASAITTILVIDDETEIVTMAQEILETENYSVLTELNPVRGIELYAQQRSHIGAVLLDMTMPEMSGKDVVYALQAIDPYVCIIITSGYSEDEVNQKLGFAKVSGFIQKPYRMQQLLMIVQNVMSTRN